VVIKIDNLPTFSALQIQLSKYLAKYAP